MHKNTLLQLCHKQMWASPAYTSYREGPDHDPRFSASVAVNGVTFVSQTLSKSVKEAYNKAAEVAVDGLSSAVSAPAVSKDVQIPYKNQLQIYAQKRNIDVLKYDSVRAGPAHALQFKSIVTVDGQTFESPEYFNTVKEAEHSAARVALMSLPQEESHRAEPNNFKNLLQELVQKQGLSLPIYNTLYDGALHTPTFTCTVRVEGESFIGEAARTKKQSEINAAKLAWDHLKQRTNLHSIKPNHGKAIDNLEHKVLLQPSSLRIVESNQSTRGNSVCSEKVMQYPCSISQKSYEGSPTSLRNQLTSIDAMDQPNLYSTPASSLNIDEDFQPYINSFPSSSLRINKDFRPNLNLFPGSSLKINEVFRPNVNSIPSSSLKINEDFQSNPNSIPDLSLRFGEDFQTRGATNVMEQQVLSIPPLDVKMKEEKPANDVQISHKTQLRFYAQKRNVGMPKYDSIRAGPAHALRFKGSVMIGGQTFESPDYFNTVKEAEHSAARVALMSLPQEESHQVLQDEPKIFKNLLQELVQKQGLSLPIYNTLYDGACRTPTFTCTVVVKGKSFVGEAARTKKQAEMNAAKNAWDHFTEQKSATRTPPMPSRPTTPSNQPPVLVYQRRKDSNSRKDPSSHVSHGKAIDNLEHKVLLQPSSLKTEERNQSTGATTVMEQQVLSITPTDVKIREEKQINDGKYQPNGVAGKNICDSVLHCNGGVVMDPNAGPSNSKNKRSNANKPQGEIFSNGSADKLNCSSFMDESKEDGSSEDGDAAIKDVDDDIFKTGDSPTLLCNRVLVYPRKPDFVLPAGATLLPLSDSTWVAVSLDFNDRDDDLPTVS